MHCMTLWRHVGECWRATQQAAQTSMRAVARSLPRTAGLGATVGDAAISKPGANAPAQAARNIGARPGKPQRSTWQLSSTSMAR